MRARRCAMGWHDRVAHNGFGIEGGHALLRPSSTAKERHATAFSSPAFAAAVGRRLVVVMAALGLTALAVVPLAASSAQASDPCVHPQARLGPKVLCPPPSPSTTSPPPTTTPPPTTAPTGPTFSSAISILDESGNDGLDHNVVGQWMSSGDFRDPRRQGSVTWSDTAQTEGTLNIVNAQPLGGPPFGLAIFESSN